MARFNKDGIAWRQCNSEHCRCRTAHTTEYNYELDRMEWKCGNCRTLTPIRKRVAGKLARVEAAMKAARMAKIVRAIRGGQVTWPRPPKS